MLTRRTFSLFGAAAAAAMLTRPATAADSPKGAFPVTKTDDEWKKTLTKEQYYVLRQHGTERAFTSPLDKTYTPVSYTHLTLPTNREV